MGFLIPIAASVAAFVTSVVTAIVSVIIAIGAWIVSAIGLILTTVGEVLAGILTGTLQGLGIISGQTAGELLLATTDLSLVSIGAYDTAFGVITAIKGYFSAFLTLIHFDTLKTIHNIAYIVSSDYRRFVNEVYRKIAEFSHALSGEAYFLIHIINNVRNVILDTSAMLGRPYDLGELTWLEEFKGILQLFETKAQQYAARPESLLSDINNLVLKPAYDLQSDIWRGIYNTIDTVVGIVDETVTDIIVIRDDIDQLVTELPQSIRQDIEPKIRGVLDEFDDFIKGKYEPALERVDEFRLSIEGRADQAENDIQNIVDRLKRPAQYLLEGDDLDHYEQMKDAEIYADLSTRIYREPVETWRETGKKADMDMKRINDLLSKPRALPLWHAGEVDLGESPQPLPSTGDKTPFPGDY